MNFRFSDACREIQERWNQQRLDDLQVPEYSETHIWPQLHRTNVLMGDLFVDYLRRCDARAGRPIPQVLDLIRQYGSGATLTPRDPGEEG